MSDHRSGVVALSGRPNAGKSTLVNRLAGEKVAIVTDRPQTTRTTVAAILHRPEAEVVLLDTPGVHRPLHRMNERMMQAANRALAEADVVAALVDVTAPRGRGDRFLLERWREIRVPVFLLLNKIDRLARPALLPAIDRWSKEMDFAEIHPVSARTGEGVARFVDSLVARLPEGPARFPADEATTVPARLLAAEIVREKLILATREELPYETTVEIEQWDEREGEDGPLRLAAGIVVERPGQKGIVLGRGGAMIKHIGTTSRLELESLLGRRVHLALHVRVREGWRDDEDLLDRLGIGG